MLMAGAAQSAGIVVRYALRYAISTALSLFGVWGDLEIKDTRYFFLKT
jgi:hypothetical protein